MAIDVFNEEVMTLTEAARRLPKRRSGRKSHVATLYRWAIGGLRSRDGMQVRLETIQVGGMPQDVKLSPDGGVYYVADMQKNGVHVIDGGSFLEELRVAGHVEGVFRLGRQALYNLVYARTILSRNGLSPRGRQGNFV